MSAKSVTTKKMPSAIMKWVALLLALTVVSLLTIVIAQKRTPTQPASTIYVMPHPDDEFQFWSILERHPDEYSVLVSLTRGEETRFCEPSNWSTSLQVYLGEATPTPEPTGKWTAECEEARINSLLGFMHTMSAENPAIPGEFAAPTTVVLDPGDEGLTPCRIDDGVKDCSEAVREVKIWRDVEERGAVVSFNLGDGDLEEPEVEWALRSLLDNQEQWFEVAAPARSLVGSFASPATARCYSYPHSDHAAIHETLWNVNFEVGPQLAATCFLDPRQTLTARVSKASARAAFSLGDQGERLGAHEIHYGWLHAQTYPLAHVRQSSLFHRVQSFWVRFS